MPIRLFVNELSFPIADCVVVEAAARLESFAGAFRAVAAIDRNISIDSAVPLSQLNFATNWPLAALRNQPTCKELGQYLQRLADRAPFNHALGEVPEDDAGGPDYRMPAGAAWCAGDPAVGIGLSHIFDGVAISLSTHEVWTLRHIDLDRNELDAAGEIVTTEVVARNAIDAEAITEHSEFLTNLVRPEVHNGAEIWERRAELFPHLRFIPRTEGQLAGLLHGDPLVGVVLDRLLKLDDAIRIWRDTGCASPPIPYYVRPESTTREALTEFKDDDQTKRRFSWHGDYGPGENRLHYILEDDPLRLAVIGHIGRKLGIG